MVFFCIDSMAAAKLCTWACIFKEHDVRILSELEQKKTPSRCTPTNLSHQGYIVETQQSSAVIENELE